MSRPKYPWWGYVREILRRYPDYTTEAEAAAVTSAIAQTGQMSEGQSRLAVIQMVNKPNVKDEVKKYELAA
ncbi:hypothetical protein [Evtepia gabavorous]|uniref:hypothetical protein n=1 Tax=Evtepia gabavorous TaxID=2211183 RepID=UPI003A2ED7BA